MKVLRWIGRLGKFLFRQKFKFLFVFFFVFLFLLFRFPYEDLSGWITEKVAQATKNKVHLRLERMRVFFFPSLGLKVSEIEVNSAYADSLKISEMRANLSIMKLLFFQLAYQVDLKGLFGGDFRLKIQKGESVLSADKNKKIKRMKSGLSFEEVDLKHLNSFVAFPLEGKIGGKLDILWDKTLTKQPEGNVNLFLGDFNLSDSSVSTPFGPMSLPEIDLSSSELKLQFSEGSFFIEQFRFGTSKNPISGEVNGNFQLDFIYKGLQMKARLSEYQFKVKLELMDSLREKFALILDILNQYKKESQKGQKKIAYQFEVKGSGLRKPPKLSSF